MIILFQFPRMFGLPNASPFCMKVENFIRMNDLDYENKFVHDPRRAPKGKLPFIKMNGQNIADSQIIIEALKRTTSDILDKDLTDLQKAESVLIENIFGEQLYWCLVYSRWKDDKAFAFLKKNYFVGLPFLKSLILPKLVRKSVLKDLHSQGLGRHSPQEMLEIGLRSLQALVTILGSKKFFMGNEMTSVDATAFAFLANFLWFPLENPFKSWLQKQPTIVEYCERMWGLLYPEMPVPV